MMLVNENMMCSHSKKTALLLIFLLLQCFLNVIWGQQIKRSDTITFEDSSSIVVNIYKDTPSELSSKYITLLPVGNNIGWTNEISFQKIIPEKHIYKLGMMTGRMGGFGGVTVSGIHYLKTGRLTTNKIFFTLKTVVAAEQGKIKHYVIKLPVAKSRYYGVHCELGFQMMRYKNPFAFSSDNSIYSISRASYGVIGLGFGYNSFQGVLLKPQSEKHMGSSRLFTAVADLVVYPLFKLNVSEVDSAATTNEPSSKNVFGRPIGFRIYMQVQKSFKYKRENHFNNCFGYTYRIGLVQSPHIHLKYGTFLGDFTTIEMGLGVFYNF
jgi:hypothetical protein